jgi:hypothetical protein
VHSGMGCATVVFLVLNFLHLEVTKFKQPEVFWTKTGTQKSNCECPPKCIKFASILTLQIHYFLFKWIQLIIIHWPWEWFLVLLFRKFFLLVWVHWAIRGVHIGLFFDWCWCKTLFTDGVIWRDLGGKIKKHFLMLVKFYWWWPYVNWAIISITYHYQRKYCSYRKIPLLGVSELTNSIKVGVPSH